MSDEQNEQAAVCQYLQTVYPDVLFWSTPNGSYLAGNKGQRVAQINKLKRTGLLPGVSDLIIFEPRGQYSAMFLEMKRDKGGKVSENQEWFLAQVEARKGFGAVANGFDEAKEIIDTYLGGK